MTNKSIIQTDTAPEAIGPYSQAVKAGDTVYISGQIPLEPDTLELVSGGFDAQVNQVFENLKAVCQASGGTIQDLVKLNIYLTDMSNFATVNEIMTTVFHEPYPARAALGVAALPKGAQVEMDAIMVLK